MGPTMVLAGTDPGPEDPPRNRLMVPAIVGAEGVYVSKS
jgi:hypothetical protein